MKISTIGLGVAAVLTTGLVATTAIGPAAASNSMSQPTQTHLSAAIQKVEAPTHSAIGSSVQLIHAAENEGPIKFGSRTLNYRDWTRITGGEGSGDDISTRLVTAHQNVPIYADNPAYGPSYVQVDGGKWFVSDSFTNRGERFKIKYEGIDFVEKKPHHCWKLYYYGPADK